jgi:transcriptional regulator with XRE-family HTH domain
MDSSIWSEERKQNAANRFANRTQQLLKDSYFRSEKRRIKTGLDLAVAVAESKLTRQDVADRAGMKLSLLSRQLSGDVNLTLDSIGRICEAIGYEFDMVLRRATEREARQPWQQRHVRGTYTLTFDRNSTPPAKTQLPLEKSRTSYKTPPCLWQERARYVETSPANDHYGMHEQLLEA